MKSDYTYEIRKIKDCHFICIEDLNLGRMSVTNNIENVIAEICEKEEITSYRDGVLGKRIPYQKRVTYFHVIYKNSGGIWDGFDARTLNFIHLGKEGWLQAAVKLLNIIK